MAKVKNSNLKELLKKTINDLMKDDMSPEIIIAKAKVLEIILKGLKWDD